MRYILLSFLFAFALVVSHAQPDPGIAQKIARKLSDSLSLTAQQGETVFDINIQLHEQKMASRKKYFNPDSLTKEIQRIENTRDSLYQAVFTEQQYILYRQKKRNLINSN